jgi:hypothetical protein
MLSRRCAALITRDPALYADLAGLLRERRIPSVSLLPGQRIPDHVAVVLTSPEEAALIAHPHILTVREDGDRRSLAAAIFSRLATRESDADVIVGIDPGPRPGYAVLSGGRCLTEGVLESPEEAAGLGAQLRHRFDASALIFRVGSGDHLARDRIVNALLALRRPIEIVDEQGTTPRGLRRPKDMLAARAIATTQGRRVHDPMPLTVTAGEIANLQRLSREGSGGRFTIPRSVAHRVLRGELSLSEAIAEGHARDHHALPSPRAPSGPRRELS